MASFNSKILAVKKAAQFKANWIPDRVSTLSEYFQVIDFALGSRDEIWFRGLSNATYKLVPTALRYPSIASRQKALDLLNELTRLLPHKIPNPPEKSNRFGWCQIAQHYGAPTRLLDWTRNPVAALYFACSKDQTSPGTVVCMNPASLNAISIKKQKIIDPNNNNEINSYFDLNATLRTRGKPNLAIYSNNTADRILAQHGSFTLHGNRNFGIDSDQAPGLTCIPILPDYKSKLIEQLDTIGIGEMYLFPEAEHVCNHLKIKYGL